MKYGRKNIRDRRRQLSSGVVSAGKKIAVLLLTCLCLLVIAGVVCIGYKVYRYAEDIISDAPDIDTIDAMPTGYMSTVLDAKGNKIAELVQSGSNRVYVTLDEVPRNLQYAFVAIEDERFYEHNGIDLKGIARAGARSLAQGRLGEGASTITQQLLKNNVFDGWTEEKTDRERITRKLQEQYLAVQLEKKVSKDWIMENYLNTINLGQNTLGVQSASRRYFGKDVSELTLSECAALAGITKNPAGYNPISHPKKNRERQQMVLDNMERLGYITEEQREEADAEDIYAAIGAVNDNRKDDDVNITSYFVDAVTDAVVKDLQKKLGYSEAEAYKALYSGGLTICSTQNPGIQKICDKAVANDGNYDCSKKVSFSYAVSIQREDGSVENFSEQTMRSYLRKNNIRSSINYNSKNEAKASIKKYKKYLLKKGGKVIGEKITYTTQPQASVTVIDQRTGIVKALVGGRGKKTASKTLNRATDVTRQPGSTFKILTAYAPALDKEDNYTLATAVKDEPVKYSSGKVVKNASGRYSGTVTIRRAIQNSINTVAVKTIQDITPLTGYNMAKEFGITTLTDNDVVEALPLGGIERGVTNMELTAAFAAIANGGLYHKPILYTKVLDHDGNVLLENEKEEKRVIKSSTAFLLTSAMQDVVKYGTGVRANFSGMSIAGKTGTAGTFDAARDSWIAGFTPYYTCAVWGGYDDYTELPSTNYTKVLWRNIMQSLHKGKKDPGFKKPKSVSRCSVCTATGLLASRECPSVRSEFFSGGTKPTKICDGHTVVTICTESGLLAGEYCPEKTREEKVYTRNSHKIPEKICDIHTEDTSEPEQPDANAEKPKDTETKKKSQTGKTNAAKKQNTAKKETAGTAKKKS